MRHARAGSVGIVAIILAYVGFCAYDASFKTFTYTCDGTRDFSIDPFLSKDALYAEIFVGGWVDAGEVTLHGFPPSAETMHFTHAAAPDGRLSASYVGDWYGRDSRIRFEASPQASCHIRIVFRVRSALSMAPLGWFW